ncbi:aminotransferase class III-fold pyridoxal phosphate-dependent enzyme [Candidatus Pelagibacter sp.]|nr:aminotransferase class III-fold pyridoxal phosphate-dependent enzyme [Candidatus Pelagibacter sp.]
MSNYAIIQARLNSTRLPDKVLKKIGNFYALEILIKRLKESKKIDRIIIATNKKSKKIKYFAKKHNLDFFEGSDKNVLKRYYDCSKKFNFKINDNIIRITGDCPFVDSKIIDKGLTLINNQDLHLVSNTQKTTYPDGLDFCIFKSRLLKNAHNKAKSDHDKEHVTPYIYRMKNLKKLDLKDNEDFSHIRLTLDTSNDLEFLNLIFKKIKSNIFFTYNDLKKCLIKLTKEEKKKYEIFFNSKKIRNIGSEMSEGYKLWINAKDKIPGGNMFLSKRPDFFLPLGWPTYYVKAKGCLVTDIENKSYYDMSAMGVGTCLLGYANSKIDKKVKKKIENGVVSTLNSVEDIELADFLLKLNPWAQMVKYTRSGGEALALSVRIARAYTGRQRILFCGYHGWHDWYLAANLSNQNNLNKFLMPNLKIKGVPGDLKNSAIPFKMNDYENFKKILKKNKIACVIMEVERNEKPKINFLKKIRKITELNDVPLIFDECTSGFRETNTGIFKKFNIEPDIAMYGKSIANGYAFSALVGKRKIMKMSNKTFASSTMWSEGVGPTAALATLKEMNRIKSWQVISKLGEYIKKQWLYLGKKHNLKIRVYGISSIPKFEIISKDFNLYKSFLTKKMLDKGFLTTTYIFISIAHKKWIINKYLNALDGVFKEISKHEHKMLNINDTENFYELVKNFRK